MSSTNTEDIDRRAAAIDSVARGLADMLADETKGNYSWEILYRRSNPFFLQTLTTLLETTPLETLESVGNKLDPLSKTDN